MASSMGRPTCNLKWFERLNQPKKLPLVQQAYVLSVLADLLGQGFALSTALQFLALLMPKYQALLLKVDAALVEGQSLEKSLAQLGFGTKIVAQLFYASRQNRLQEALLQAAQRLHQARLFRKEMAKQLAYPGMMGLCLVGMLFGMRTFILPQVTSFISQEVYEREWLVRFLIGFFTYLPQLSLVLLAVGLLGLGAGGLLLQKASYLKRYAWLRPMPLLGKWLSWQLTQQVAYELGYFLAGGLSLQQMLQVWMDYPVNPFLAELAHYLMAGCLEGRPLTQQMSQLGLFTRQFPLIIEQGELTSQLSAKCLVYAAKLGRDLQEDMTKKIHFIQPILFIFIGLLVVAMYLVMMLPMLTIQGL